MEARLKYCKSQRMPCSEEWSVSVGGHEGGSRGVLGWRTLERPRSAKPGEKDCGEGSTPPGPGIEPAGRGWAWSGSDDGLALKGVEWR
jgi:hypothetical protein